MVVRVGVGCMMVWVEVVVLGVLGLHVVVLLFLVYLRRQSIEDKTQVKVVTKYFVLSK